MLWSQTQDSGHFSKLWEIQLVFSCFGFFWGGFFLMLLFLRKKRIERKKALPQGCAQCLLPVDRCSQETQPALQGGFLLRFIHDLPHVHQAG